METNLFIIGADGLIGSQLAQKAQQNKVPWAGTSRKTARGNIVALDLRNEDEIRNLAIHSKITFLCAAETDLRKCENHPAETRLLNVERTLQAARHLHQTGSAIVFLSSNLVFDGTQAFVPVDAKTCPVIEYGKQKAEVEKILLSELDRVAIVRLTKVVHRDFPLFKQWLTTLRSGNVIRPFSNMPFSPVDLALVVEELWALTGSFQKGIFQLSGDSDISYATAAATLAKVCSIDAQLIQPQTTDQAGYRHYFPRHTTLAHRAVRAQQKPESVSPALQRLFQSITA